MGQRQRLRRDLHGGRQLRQRKNTPESRVIA